MIQRLTEEYYDDEITEKANFVSEHKNKHCYEVEFSDENGQMYTQLEHGGTFDNVPHIRFNHH